MQHFFWKIFISFWFSLTLFVGATLVTASIFVERMRNQDAAESVRNRLHHYTDEARIIAERDGVEGLKTWLFVLDQKEVIPFLLINSKGEDLLNRQVPIHLSQIILHLRKFPLTGKDSAFPGPPIIRVSNLEEYNLIPDFKSITLGRILSRPRIMVFPLLTAALISSVVSFFLAGYFTRPLRKLSNATYKFSSGDLDFRIAPAMGNRKDEIAQLAQEFDHMAERLQGLICSQKQLLSDVSHELRSPLARLQIAVGLAHQKNQDIHLTVEIDRIEREAEHLNQLIGYLLSFSRLEGKTQFLTNDVINLNSLIKEIAERSNFEAHANEREVKCVCSLKEISVKANEAMLSSALENIVRNAIKYTSVNTTVSIILEQLDEEPELVNITIQDYGPGVPENMLEKIFEPFVRVEEDRDRKTGSYGLGLAIAQRAINLHGGTISAENARDGGLMVTIRLPVKI
jgi:two-component system sensor histidine kinase CpxA